MKVRACRAAMSAIASAVIQDNSCSPEAAGRNAEGWLSLRVRVNPAQSSMALLIAGLYASSPHI